MADSNSQDGRPTFITVHGTLKYNSVFLTSVASIELIQENGYGAKQFNPLHVRPSSDFSADEIGVLADDEFIVETAEDNSDDDEVGGTNRPMMLFVEEAFYLFHLGLLELSTPLGKSVALQTLWSKFSDKNKNFPFKYKVYSHFRSMGMVVKTGIHSGLDYSVYRTLPTRCHSEMCAMVVDALGPLSLEEGATSSCQIAWRHLSTLTRVMPDVMKLLGLCYVHTENEEPLVQNESNGTALEVDERSGGIDGEGVVVTRANGEVISGLKEILGTPKTSLNVRKSGIEKLDYMYGPGESKMDRLDLSTPTCLDKMRVRVVTVLVRRLPIRHDQPYITVGDIQQKYRDVSILKVARQAQTVRKKRKKRRDHTAVREKKKSKHKSHWTRLLRGDIDEERRTNSDSSLLGWLGSFLWSGNDEL